MSVTDHALLRWMERMHGVDIEGWRQLMIAEVEASLEAFEGIERPGRASFVVSPGNRVVTVLDEFQKRSLVQSGVAIPRIGSGS